MLRPLKNVHMHFLFGLWMSCSPFAPKAAAPKPATSVAPPGDAIAPALATERHDVEFRDVRFRDGRVLERVRSHYSVAGTPRRDARGRIVNAVLMLHRTSASGDALQSESFVDALYARGRPLDLAQHYLIFIDSIGHGRSSKPSDGLHARFPSYGYEDIVTLQYRTVTEALGIDHLHAIIGLSMGGMNAWRWAERYPDLMDAIVPIVALPAPISGRNLVWRRFVALQIRNDPSWKGGDYESPPRGWLEAFPVFRMMLDGVPHLHDTVASDSSRADRFIRDASAQAAKMDANDVLYALEASSDYDPSASLESIRARVFALNFGDDEFNPTSLGILEENMRRVPRGTFVIQPGDRHSSGHFTQAHPELWADRVGEFMHAIESAP